MPAKSKPLVSILCITYNHERFIKKALDGFLMQETDFEFEIIIHDDASTDSTEKIIREYDKSNPGVFVPLYEKKNQYSLGNFSFISDMLKQAKGKYIAFCEGDDYWTDPKKLQKQVDFLENKPDYALCFHLVQVIYDDGSKSDAVFPDLKHGKTFDVKELLHDNYIQTNSVLYRRQDYKSFDHDIVPQDWYLHLYHARFGKIGFIEEVMSVYRRHEGGTWWTSDKDRKEFWVRNGMKYLRLYSELLTLYKEAENKRTICNSISRVFRQFTEFAADGSHEYLDKAISEYPELAGTYVLGEHERAQEAIRVLKDHQKELKHNQKAVELKESHIKNLEEELARIKGTAAWKAYQKTHKLRNGFKRS